MTTEFDRVLICPYCRGRLDDLVCTDCGDRYERTSSGAIDLRLRRTKREVVEFPLGEFDDDSSLDLSPLSRHPAPAVDFSGIEPPEHLSRELLSHFPAASDPGSSLMLDLGCGDGKHRGVCEQAGFRHVGVDYESAQAPILADAHALPFEEDTFEFLLSIAALEHMSYPFVALREAGRVLQPGGTFVGTVAFLEPFHGRSYFHHTHLGLLRELKLADLEVVRIAPDATWTGLRAQAKNALFPGMPPRVAMAVVKPVDLLHRLSWRVAERKRGTSLQSVRLCQTTGAFYFIARKPVADAAT
ncbi:MAG: class I SAM-dependent methyltransferase [Actinomycetota bacterium]